MSRVTWDDTGKRLYETGVDHGVLYPMGEDGYDSGVAWNGLTNVSESPTGAEANPQYADNIKYLNLYSNEDFEGTIEAYTYPDEFALCDGSVEIADGVFAGQQTRRMFALCYRTLIGNDVKGSDYGYKLHILYGAMASPSEKGYETINDSPEAITFSWEVTTTPVSVKDLKPTSLITIDSTKVDKDKLKELEDKLYGTEESEPKLLMPDEIAELIGKKAA